MVPKNTVLFQELLGPGHFVLSSAPAPSERVVVCICGTSEVVSQLHEDLLEKRISLPGKGFVVSVNPRFREGTGRGSGGAPTLPLPSRC